MLPKRSLESSIHLLQTLRNDEEVRQRLEFKRIFAASKDHYKYAHQDIYMLVDLYITYK